MYASVRLSDVPVLILSQTLAVFKYINTAEVIKRLQASTTYVDIEPKSFEHLNEEKTNLARLLDAGLVA